MRAHGARILALSTTAGCVILGGEAKAVAIGLIGAFILSEIVAMVKSLPMP